VELDDLPATLTLLDCMLDARPYGVTDVVPAARTLLVHFDPFLTDRDTLTEAVSRMDFSARRARHGETFNIAITYDGEDLADVAEILGCTTDEVIRRHTEATYTVAFTGFAPGFAYMTCDDNSIDVPRRKTPRLRVPAASVALGGKFCGIYPSDSPGGWQLLGTTPLEMWDITRDRAALLAPGDRVRFRAMEKGAIIPARKPPQQTSVRPETGLLVRRADRPALYQDLGRPGRASQGVSQSGALDHSSLIEANLCVGNPRHSTAVEIAFGGFAVKADRAVTAAVTGASCPIVINTARGTSVTPPSRRAFALDAGDELVLGIPPEGMRSYLAVRGGFAVEPVLGSAATDTLAKVGPAPIITGDWLGLAEQTVAATDPYRPVPKALPGADDAVTLDVIPGPRTDWFTQKGVETLFSQEWQVTAESSRIGMRLAGAEPLEKRDAAELPSEGTVPGAIQVPHSGQPVLFLADHPLTGGYPVIGVVASHHLDLAGQIPIGAKIRFRAIATFDPLFREAVR